MYERYRKINELLMCVNRRRKQIGESAMAELDIQPSQHFVLAWLKHLGRAASQTQLAQMMRVSPANVARNLKNLDRDGFIRRSGGTDSRCNEIAITEKGEQMLNKSLALFQKMDARCYAGFSDAELDQLHSLMSRLLENMNEIKKEMEGDADQ